MRDILATDVAGVPKTPVVTCFLLKVASRCNLACDYCYVYEHADQTWRHQPKLMSQWTAHMVGERLNEYLKLTVNKVTVVIHGGEPLLLGVKRMKALLQAIIGKLDDAQRVSFSIQTNGVLVTPRWLDLFHRYGVTVSVSADGPSDINDLHRLDHSRRSTYGSVERALHLLTRSPKYKELLGGVLSVVDLSAEALHIITWAERLGIPSIDFLLPDGTYEKLPNGVSEPGIRNNAATYGRWLAKGFDYWYASSSSLRIRLFENILDLCLGGESRTEGIGPSHFSILTIETNGEIQDTDVMKITEEGAAAFGSTMNVRSMTFNEILESKCVQERVSLATKLPTTCRTCVDVKVCGAGHLPHRFSADNGFSNPSIYCGDLSYLIRHIRARIELDLPRK